MAGLCAAALRNVPTTGNSEVNVARAGRKSSRPGAGAALEPLLHATHRRLASPNVVVFDEVLALHSAQLELLRGRPGSIRKAANAALMLPLLDTWRRLAAHELNEAAAQGLPNTAAARRRLAASIRVGTFGTIEHQIRALVQVLYPIRRNEVCAHQRRGRPTRGYFRTYGDPAEWKLPPALLTDSARDLYEYVLRAPLPKKSGW